MKSLIQLTSKLVPVRLNSFNPLSKRLRQISKLRYRKLEILVNMKSKLLFPGHNTPILTKFLKVMLMNK